LSCYGCAASTTAADTLLHVVWKVAQLCAGHVPPLLDVLKLLAVLRVVQRLAGLSGRRRRRF
jgi:hypothetical protein